MSKEEPSARDYVLLAQATSGVSLGDSEVEIAQVPANGRRFSVRIGTRKQPFAGSGPSIPTGLQATISGPSTSIDQMLEDGIIAVNQVAPFLAFLGNSAINDFVPEVVWDATPAIAEREYFQLFVRAGLPSIVKPRSVSPDDVLIMSQETLKHPKSDRVRRALGQYFRALENWRPGHETIAVTSLWIAAEILTPLARLRAQERLNCSSPAELAHCLGVEPKDLDPKIRRDYIIGPDVYPDAKSASDGFEHGFLDFSKVMGKCVPIKEKLAGRIRRTIFDEIKLERDVKQRLLSGPYERPGCTVEHKFVRARLVDPEGKYSSPPLLRPFLSWEERWTANRLAESQATTLRMQDTFTPLVDPSVVVKDIRVEIRAGQEGYLQESLRDDKPVAP